MDKKTEVYANVDEFGKRKLIISWEREGVGFGLLTISTKDDGTFELDTEFMGRDFAKEILNQLVDEASVEYKED